MADDSKEPAINCGAGRVIFVLCSLKSEYSCIFPGKHAAPAKPKLVEPVLLLKILNISQLS